MNFLEKIFPQFSQAAKSARLSLAPAGDVKSTPPVNTGKQDTGGDRSIEAYGRSVSGGTFFAYSFTGEKNIGDMGPIKQYYVDYDALRERSWQQFLDSDVYQTVLSKFADWVVGKGLKLQCEPQSDTLKTEGIELSEEEIEIFNDQVESRFETYSGSTMSDHSGMRSLHKQAKIAYINSIVGGDVLVIMRLKGEVTTIQLIDGGHIVTPMGIAFNGQDYTSESGNIIRNGIEMDANGRHIAYYVRKGLFETERIPAYGAKTGRVMAFLVESPLRFRIDNHRSLPVLAAAMETISKMDRYKEATLGSAEESAKIILSVEHQAFSDGENPFKEMGARMSGVATSTPTPIVNGEAAAQNVTRTTGKTAINMPLGSKLTPFESKKELYFKDFYTVNIGIICAVVGIPVDVALSKYESSYSSSRAAIKDWEHKLDIAREEFATQFYKKIADFWLYVQVLTNKVAAPGYLTAMATGNRMAVEAYCYSRWVGANVPHIDPMKEVQAIRLMLGDQASHIPLTTVEAATESLGKGGSYSNISQFGKELKEADEAGIEKSKNIAPQQQDEQSDEQEKGGD